jgi:hypothetical protein
VSRFELAFAQDGFKLAEAIKTKSQRHVKENSVSGLWKTKEQMIELESGNMVAVENRIKRCRVPLRSLAESTSHVHS